MKTKINTSKSAKQASHKRLITAGLILAGVLVVAQATFDTYSYFRARQYNDDTAMIHLITGAVEGLQRPAVVEGRTGKIYLPDAKIVLPPPDGAVRDLRYSYDDSSRPAELRVTTDNILHSAEAKLWVAQSGARVEGKYQPLAVFKQVPNLQACARGVLGSFDQPTSDTTSLSPAGRVKLNDGRQLYLYTENNCDANLTTVAKYLKKAQSY